MKLIVFGATGTIGSQLVRQALAQGHRVTAFARRPAALEHAGTGLGRVAGDVLDRADVESAMRGHDAVLVALGAGRKGAVRSAGTANVVAAMCRHGLRRLVCLSTLGAGDSRAQLNFFWKRVMFGLLLREAYADHQAQEALVRRSELDWTLVRPGAFIDGPATGAYKHGFAPTDKSVALKVSRADVARFMLAQLTDSTYLRATPGLSY